MPRPPAHRGSASLISRWRFQLLGLDVELRADSRLTSGIEFLVNSAQHPFAPTERALYVVSPDGMDYVISRNGSPCDKLPGPDAAVDALFARVSAHALGLMPDRALVRGALGVYHGRRFLLCGEHGAGLTTLAVRLLHQGAAIEGDAFATLGDEGLLAVPRRFCLRWGARDVLPEIAGLLEKLPSRPDGANGRIWAFDPVEAGFDWKLGDGPVDLCVSVEPNHGGHSMLVPAPHYEMARLVTSRCSPSADRSAVWIRRIAALVDGASCFRLQLGRLEDAVDLLRDAE